MAKVKKRDFIEIEYIGRIKGSNHIFDLTDEKLARENGLYNPNIRYGARIVCVGEGDLISGLDKALIDKEVGKLYTIEVTPKEGFGERNNKLIRTISGYVFTRDKVNPFPGLQLNIDGMLGTVRSVSSGRVTVDFNHPLSGRDIIYEIKINKIIEDNKLKVESILRNKLNLDEKDYNLTLNENKAEIALKKDNKLKDKIKNVMKDLINIDATFVLMK